MLRRVLAILTAIDIAAVAGALVFLFSSDVVNAPHILAYLTRANEKPAVEEASATLTFVGDIMLAREVEVAVMQNGVDWPFAAIKNTWTDSDLVIGNFESTVRDAYRYEGGVLAFDVQPEHITGLKDAGFTHLSLANNHGDDFGSSVTQYTRDAVAALGITPFGDPIASEDYIARAEPNGVPVSLIGFHAFIEQPAAILDAIRTEHDAGRFVIVYPHWGTEYQVTSSVAQQEATQLFVDAGADLIVGSHPHVIEPIDDVSGVPVAWSLGNFVFDQDWSPATQEGLLLTVTVTNNAVTLTPTPITIKNRQPAVMQGNRVQTILENIGVPHGSISFARKETPNLPINIH